MKELKNLRKLREKHFLTPTGEIKAYVYDQNVHYFKNGKYYDIDNRIQKKNNELVNKQNAFKSIFNNEQLLRIEKGNHYLMMNLEGENHLQPLKKSKRKVLLENIIQNTDIDYELIGNQVKESIIIKNKKDIHDKYTFIVDTNLELKIEKNKIIAYDKDKPEFRIEKPYMVDKNDVYNHNVTYQLSKQQNQYKIDLILDKDWLLEEKRAYPVLIDPTITEYDNEASLIDTYIYEGDTNEARAEQPILKVGVDSDGKVYRSLLKFHLPKIGTGSQVIEASLNMLGVPKYTFYKERSYIDLHEITCDWTESGANWNNMHDEYKTRIEYFNKFIEPIAVGGVIENAEYNSFDVTNLVKKWYAGTPNYGVMLKAHKETKEANEALCQYFSKNNTVQGDNPKPILAVTYRNQNGLESYLTYKSQSFKEGLAHVNTYTGNLTAAIDLTSTIGGNMPANLTLFYNTNDVVLNNNLGYGLGYKLNYHQTLIPETIDGIEYLNYTDEDGTMHYFRKNGNTYYDEDGLFLSISSFENNYTMIDKDENKLHFSPHNNIWYLNRITNNKGYTTTIKYDNKNRIYQIIDDSKNEINLTYSTTGIVFTNTHKTGLININELGQITSLVKNGKTTVIHYNNLHLIDKITDTNQLSLQYEYYDMIPYRLKKITELGLNNELGKEMNIAYDFNVTTFTDELGHKNTYTFNNRGNAQSISNLDMHGSLKNAYGKNYSYGDYFTQKVPNQLQNSEQLNKTVKNYIINSSFEEDEDAWHNTSIATVVSANARTGKKCAYINDKGGHLFKFQELDTGADYTLSAYAKGTGKIQLYIGIRDEETRLEDFYTPYYNLSDEYERFSLSMHLPKGYVNLVEIYINVVDGDAYIDDIQLEEGNVANYYNLIDNSDFREDLKYWRLTSSTQIKNADGSTEYLEIDPNYEILSLEDNQKAIKIYHDPYISHTLDRTFNISGKAGDTYNVSFWYKHSGIDNPMGAGGYPANCLIAFGYIEDDEFGGDQEPQARLNFNETEWQYYSETFVAEKDYENLYFLLMMENTANEMYLTNFTIYKDLSRVDFQYDKKGNIIEASDLDNNSTKFNYDNNNQLIKLMDPKGNKFQYEYDNNIPTRILSGIADNGISYEMKYDTFGNPIRTKTKVVKKAEDLPTGKYFIREKSSNKYFTADFKSKEILLKENVCSKDVWIFEKISDHRYNIHPAVLPDYYIANEPSNYQHLTLSKIPNIDIEIYINDNGSYNMHTANKIMRDDTGAQIMSNGKKVQCYSNGPTLGINFEFYIESAEYPYFMENEAEYTEDGKFIKSITDTLLNKITYDIDPKTGLTTSVTNPANIITSYTYNEQELLTSVNEDNKTIEYVYDNNDNISAIKSGNKAYNFTYDAFLNPKTVSINNLITLITNEYYERNRGLKKSTYGNGHIINYTYDEIDRLKTVRKEDATYEYKYDNFNNLTEIEATSDNTQTIYNYGYDTAQKLINYRVNNFGIKYKYDKNQNITNKTYNLENIRKTKEFIYNSDDTLKTSKLDNIDIQYNYDPLGRLKERVIGNYKTEYGYLTKGYRTSNVINSITNGNIKYSYKYDKLNNITHIYKDNILTNEYFYDNFNELIKEHDYERNITIEYNYDTEGNILSKKTYSLNTTTLIEENIYEYNNPDWEDQLTTYNGTNITYDGIGNPKTIGDSINLYWKNGRELAKYQDTSKNLEIIYKYNKDGIRTSKIVNGIEEKYYLENKNILFANKGNNMIYYLRDSNSGLIGLKHNDTTYYYQKNAQEDITGIMDGNFNIVATYSYDAWGNIISIKDANGNVITDNNHIAHINPYRYRSYYYDEETKLYYLNSRYYNPTWGRFINCDQQFDTNGFIGFNIYSYVLNNPTNSHDNNGYGAMSNLKSSALKFARKFVGFSSSTTKVAQQKKLSLIGASLSSYINQKTISNKSNKFININANADADDFISSSVTVRLGDKNAVHANIGIKESSIGIETESGTSYDAGISAKEFSLFISASKSTEIADGIEYEYGARIDINLLCFVVAPILSTTLGTVKMLVNSSQPVFQEIAHPAIPLLSPILK